MNEEISREKLNSLLHTIDKKYVIEICMELLDTMNELSKGNKVKMNNSTKRVAEIIKNGVDDEQG